MFQYRNWYTINPIFYNSAISIRSISFFSASDMHQSHHLSGWHMIGINSSFNSFLSALRFLNLIRQSKSLA